MEQPTSAPLKKTPLNARHRASGARMVPYSGWDMPLEYSGIARRAHGRSHASRAVRRQPHGGDRDRGQGRAGCASTNHLQRRLEAPCRRRAVLGRPDPCRHLRGRRARVPARTRALSARRERRTDREGLRLDRGPDQRRRRRRRRRCELALRHAGRAGTGRPRRGPAAHWREPARSQVLLRSPTARSRTSARRSREPDIPARTGSRFSSRRSRPTGSGRRFLHPAVPPVSCPPVWARATPCGSKPRCACTATTSTRRPPP